MVSMISTLANIFTPDRRKGTLALEEFDYNLSRYLDEQKKSISNDDKRYLLDLFIKHKDSEIDKFLKSL